MKKSKLEKLNAKRKAKHKQIKKRVQYIKKATKYEEAEDLLTKLKFMMMLHFPSGEFACGHCTDYRAEVCSGKGLATFEECMDCMVQQIASGQTIRVLDDGVVAEYSSTT